MSTLKSYRSNNNPALSCSDILYGRLSQKGTRKQDSRGICGYLKLEIEDFIWQCND